MRFQHLPTLRSDLPTNVGFLWWFNTLKLAGHENTPSCPYRNLPHCNHQIDSDQSILSSGNAAGTKKLPLTAGGRAGGSTEGVGWPSFVGNFLYFTSLIRFSEELIYLHLYYTIVTKLNLLMYLLNIDYAHSGCENAAYELQSCDLQSAGKNCPTIPDLVCLASFVKSFAYINNFYLPGSRHDPARPRPRPRQNYCCPLR